MSMYRSISLFFFLILAIGTAGVAFAADVTVKVDKEKNLAVVTSSLPTDVTLLFLVGPGNRRLPLYGKMAPGKSIEIPLRYVMPKAVSYAACEIPDPPKGYEKELDNYYHLSVDIL